MKIEFFNIVKNTLPLLVCTNRSYDNYVKNLTSSSKRFLNLSYKHFNNNILAKLEFNFKKTDLLDIPPQEKKELLNLILTNLKKPTQKEHCFVKYYNNYNKLIAYNYISITESNIKTGYSNCLVLLDINLVKNKTFNTFTWFKMIELIFNCKLLDVLDLVVDPDLYKYEKIINNKIYNCDALETCGSYLLKRDKTVGKFNNNNNSSKFLFLTKQDKLNTQLNLISVVCKCGHKTLLNIYDKKTVCFCCKAEISRII